MPLQKLQFRPGLNKDQTNYTNEGGWFECDKIRFRSGYPEKIGGWAKATLETFLGTCRQMFNYITSFGDNILAMGTNLKVYLQVGGSFYDVTPLQHTSTTLGASAGPFTATNGSSIITVSYATDPLYEPAAGNFVTFAGATSLGGNITAAILNQNYEILTADSTANTYTIDVGVQANASDTAKGGATVTAYYEINTGAAGGTYGYGWGTGGWGSVGWGLSSTQPILIPQQDWFFDSFSNDLIMNIRNGAIYIWERGALTNPSVAYGTRAVRLDSLAGAAYVPDEAMQILVSQNDRHLIAFGATPYGGGDFDPLLIRWATQDFPENWTVSATTTAGFFRCAAGSQIVRAILTRQEILVYTDTALYSMQFLGTTDVFGLQQLADNISIISPRAVATVNNTAFWMGKDKFYSYSGRVDTLPCTLRNYIFKDINFAQADQIVCGTNEGWNEIWWFYPSAESNTNNRYIIYNHLERIWYYGNIDRTAWLDSPLREYPQAVSSAQPYLYNHEYGSDDDTLPLEAYITSSDYDISDGDQFTLIKRIIPDVSFAGSTNESAQVKLQFLKRNFPGNERTAVNDDYTVVSDLDVDSYTEQVFTRLRSRQVALKVTSEALGVQWQLGSPRLDGRPDGKR
jgi:hypothetical protein